MKTLLTLISIIALSADAGTVRLAWEASTTPDVEYVVFAHTNAITDGYGYVDLRRTDEITPSGSLYRFTCPDLGLNHTTALEASTFDLSTLIE